MNDKMPIDNDFVAFVDEAGAKGLSRNLMQDRDSELGVFCALLVPTSRLSALRERVSPGFERFKLLMPDGAKLHITEAFKHGGEWASVARDAHDP